MYVVLCCVNDSESQLLNKMKQLKSNIYSQKIQIFTLVLHCNGFCSVELWIMAMYCWFEWFSIVHHSGVVNLQVGYLSCHCIYNNICALFDDETDIDIWVVLQIYNRMKHCISQRYTKYVQLIKNDICLFGRIATGKWLINSFYEENPRWIEAEKKNTNNFYLKF